MFGVLFLEEYQERSCSRNAAFWLTRGQISNITRADKQTFWLQQTQLAGTCDRFGAPLNLELAKDFPIVPFHRVQGEEKPLTHFLIRESLSHEAENL